MVAIQRTVFYFDNIDNMIEKLYNYLSYSNLLEEAVFWYENEEWERDELRFSRCDIQEARINYWGSFLHALGHALTHADPHNANLIISTFNKYILEMYCDWVLNCIIKDNEQ